MKIEFHYQNDFKIEDETVYRTWLQNAITSYRFKVGVINYIFLSDGELLEMNRKYLGHDTYTDIISFDYTVGKTLAGDIFISSDRVKENAVKYEVSTGCELRRVMAHGVLHFIGYTDKTDGQRAKMQKEEDKFLQMFHVEQ